MLNLGDLPARDGRRRRAHPLPALLVALPLLSGCAGGPQEETVPTAYGPLTFSAGDRFRDCADCPTMAIVPAGSFRMGSPANEDGRRDVEGPVRRVTIGEPFAVGVHEITRSEYAWFVSETGYRSGNACWVYRDGDWASQRGRSWRSPGYPQTGSHPAVCVSWRDAQAYVRWLSRKAGKRYRLLSEAEWEYAARAGTTASRFWGDGESAQCRHANGADEASGLDGGVSCDDGHAWTSPVGSYAANGFGLHDMLGNASEWTHDCWSENYEGAPSDGRARIVRGCTHRLLRGGSWSSSPDLLRSADRSWLRPEYRDGDVGIRVARSLTPSELREFEDRRLAEAERRRAQERRLASSSGLVFRDCAACPKTAVVPAGSSRMDSPSSEVGRTDDEGPVRTVTIREPFAIGAYPVTRAEYGQFVSETRYRNFASFWALRNGKRREGLFGTCGFRDLTRPVLIRSSA